MVVSRAKYTRSARHLMYIYVSRTVVESNLDYRILITAKRIKFLLRSIERASLNYIKYLFLLRESINL